MATTLPYTQPAPHQFIQTCPDTATVPHRARFSIHALCANDREALRALFARLSAESRHRRFLTGKTELTERELTYFTDIDHIRHEALKVIDTEHGSLVGVARYVALPEQADSAEVAIEVADDLQRHGIGLLLGQALVRRARENGIKFLVATTLWENHAARALARRLGFRARSSAGTEIELELQLSDHAEHVGIPSAFSAVNPRETSLARSAGSRQDTRRSK